MELIIDRKPINEMLLPNSNSQSVKGVKGFQKSINPKTEQVRIMVTTNCKSFLDDYCKLNNITYSKLFLAGLECYTGFNGSNNQDIINELKEMLEMESEPIPASKKRIVRKKR
jgi:plasmid replication initiation protein